MSLAPSSTTAPAAPTRGRVRLLHICDPDGGLPVASSPEAAIAATGPPRSHLRLVPAA